MVMPIVDQNEVMQLVKKHADTGLKLDLLYFWNKHPYAKFTSGVITHIVDSKRRFDVKEALEAFADAEIIEKHVEHGLPFYCLTTAPEKREPILQWVCTSAHHVQTSAHDKKRQVTQHVYEES